MARSSRNGRRLKSRSTSTARMSVAPPKPLRTKVARAIRAGHSAFYRAQKSPLSLRIGTGPIAGATKRRLQRGVRDLTKPTSSQLRRKKSRVQRSHKVRSHHPKGLVIDKKISRAANRNAWRRDYCVKRPDSRTAAKRRWEYAKTGTAPAHKFPALLRWC